MNLDTTTTNATTPVVSAPTALTAALAFHLGSLRRRWCCTIPAWDRVKPVNTPTAYRGIRALMLPLNTTISTPATAARKMMPLENTSRSPRLANWRGRKPSRAMMEDNRGKSAYAVLAARMRMANVAICVIQNSTPLPP